MSLSRWLRNIELGSQEPDTASNSQDDSNGAHDWLHFADLLEYIKDSFRSLPEGFNDDDKNLRVPIYSIETIRNVKSVDARNAHLLLRRYLLSESLASHGKCYPPLILKRAETYEALEFPDLAAADAYAVYMLCQKALSEDEWVIDLDAFDLDGQPWLPSKDTALELIVDTLGLLCRCLIDLGATRDADEKREELMSRYTELKPSEDPAMLQQSIENNILRPRGLLWSMDTRCFAHDKLKVGSASKFGLSRREIYPWNTYEPDRNSASSVAEINTLLKRIAPDLEARVTTLPALNESGSQDGLWHQLGLFARRDFAAGEEILNEKSILTAIRPLDAAICDACGADLEAIVMEGRSECPGDDCDITFCSADCAERAKTQYHQPFYEAEESENDNDAEEERETADHNSSEHNATRAVFCGNHTVHSIGRHETSETPEWDLYFLLLARTVAMSITQDIHPLDLPEIKHLWGDFTSPPSPPLASNASPPPATLPFSVTHNLSLPLDFFTTLSDSLSIPLAAATPYSAAWLRNFDPWIQQTLVAKFRGVANATQSTFDGKAETAAVHPLWCLANHSCAPNVRWTPSGTRVFTVRADEADEGENQQQDMTKNSVKIRAGDEILSHYTDPRLPLRERRERLREVLGGDCRCERCLKEEREEHG